MIKPPCCSLIDESFISSHYRRCREGCPLYLITFVSLFSSLALREECVYSLHYICRGHTISLHDFNSNAKLGFLEILADILPIKIFPLFLARPGGFSISPPLRPDRVTYSSKLLSYMYVKLDWG